MNTKCNIFGGECDDQCGVCELVSSYGYTDMLYCDHTETHCKMRKAKDSFDIIDMATAEVVLQVRNRRVIYINA